MGRREGDSRAAMSTCDRSELRCLQDKDPCGTDMGDSGTPGEVKKHQHKHNLKHRYEMMETLGKGTYGKVKKAVEKASLRTVAIKSIRKDRITEDLERIHIQREIEITSSLRHLNIIRFHEVFESRDKIVIVMEFASRGELYDYIQEKGRLSETEARSIFRQITSAVHYCHKNGVVHRDLKLENILLDHDLNVKLADFGLSNYFLKSSSLQTYCGSPLYASPEIVKGLPYTGPEVDCWALGVLLYALVYSSMPFDGTNHAKLIDQISRGQYHRPNRPSDACALIDWLLTVRVQERATIEDVANHWWVNWTYEESVCNCPSNSHHECPSPLLARYIDWQSQAAPGATADAGYFSYDISFSPQLGVSSQYFSSSLKDSCMEENADMGAGQQEQVSRGMLSLRKSRKENAIPQSTLGAGGGVASTSPPSSVNSLNKERRKPKGILKHQRSLDSVFHSSNVDGLSCKVLQSHRTQTLGQIPPSSMSANLKVPSAFSQPSSKMPKKGILKNLNARDLSDDSERGLGDNGMRQSSMPKQHTRLTAVENSPTMQTEAARKRKGILKRNGKFSRSLDLSDDPKLSPPPSPAVFPAMSQSGKDKESSHSRPSSVVSEDSMFSSDSYDLLDFSAQPLRDIFAQKSECRFEEN